MRVHPFRSGPMPPHPVSEADWLRAAEALGQGETVLLGLWGGSSGASPLDYRWGTVRRLVLDVQEGLARAGA